MDSQIFFVETSWPIDISFNCAKTVLYFFMTFSIYLSITKFGANDILTDKHDLKDFKVKGTYISTNSIYYENEKFTLIKERLNGDFLPFSISADNVNSRFYHCFMPQNKDCLI